MRKLRLALPVALALVLAAAGLSAYLALRGSLPVLDGTFLLVGLAAPVEVERDALGVPTIRGGSRLDVARATGFLHAQERFFQMDLQRRSSAGELAELFGVAALPADREARVHRFRTRARVALASLPAGDRALLETYAAGVNAGLAALASPPFEYLLLGSEPRPWAPEDAGLTVLAMYQVLQDPNGTRESALGVMRDVLPDPLFEFLAAPATRWDAPIVGGPLPVPPIPGPEVFDVRAEGRAHFRPAPRAARNAPLRAAAGSNNWTVAGSLTAHGGAIVADDMHLPLSVPNIWYRASLVYPDAAGGERRITGATLPGAPIAIVGSNGHIAWGFTNTQGDWGDLVVIEPVVGQPDAYHTPAGPRSFEHFAEIVRVRDGEDVVVDVVETIWGPIVDRDHRGRQRAHHWIAHDPRAGNVEARRLEGAKNVRDAIEIANRSGIPNQNFVVGDRAGHIGWTIIGAIPRRFGHDGLLPSSWADGRRGWDGWLTPGEYPRVVDPPSGRLWSANARTADGALLAKIGRGGYVSGARAGQIRDNLFAAERFDERALLAIQLDDRAIFLAPWRELLLEILNADAVRDDPRRGELRGFVENWGARAAPDSVGYRIVREFRTAVEQRAFPALTSRCSEADPRFDYADTGHQQEGPLWLLVSERPRHLLDPAFESWESLLLAAADQVLADALAAGASLREFTWGAYNTADIRHPMSPFVPLLSLWLDMPADPLPGDTDMPLAQTHAYGVSERMIVSPGREEEGIFHMPTGQSAHPLSPFFGRGHAAWVRGEPTPFLPGPPQYVLHFEPAG